MQRRPVQGQEIVHLSGHSAETLQDEASSSVSDEHYRASYATAQASLSVAQKLRQSISRALLLEDQPDPCLEPTRPWRMTVDAVTPPTRPPRPPRPRHSAGSWLVNSSGNPWVDIELHDKSTALKDDNINSHQRSKSAGAGSQTTFNMSDTTETGSSLPPECEKVVSAQPQPVGFWHKSMKQERRHVIGRWALMTLILSIFILAILSLFWAVVVNVDAQMRALNVYVVNFETISDALVGPIVTNVTEQWAKNTNEVSLGFTTLSPESFNGDPLAVREAVFEQEAWAAIVINENATQLLRQAVGFTNTTYDPYGALQVIYTEARAQDVYFDHIYPLMQLVQSEILANFGEKWTKEIMSNSAVTKASMELVPQAVNPGIGFSTYQLRPFLPHTGIPAVSIGLIYLIILSFFSFSFYLPIHMRLMKGPGHPPLRFWQFIVWRWTATNMAYFFLSLAYSLVSLAFKFPFGNSPGSHYVSEVTPSMFYNATFVVYWVINFLGMIALGLACENMAMFLGLPWTALWLIFWVITNVATSFYEITLESFFFKWGYAWPLHNIVEASRTVLFDLHSNLPTNFGVLIAWGVVNTAIFPFACLYMKWKAEKAMAKVGKPF